MAFGSGAYDDTKKSYIAGDVKLWDAQTGEDLLTVKGGKFEQRVAFSPSSHWLACFAGVKVTIYDATPLLEQP